MIRSHNQKPSFLRNSSGAVLVEFALIAPLFVAIIIGGIDLGRYLFQQHELNSAVQEAGRFAMVRGSSSTSPVSQANIAAFAAQQLSFNDVNNVTFTVSFDPDQSKGSVIRISGEAAFPVIAGILSTSGIRLKATSVNVFIN